MARVLVAWELGRNFGHLARLAPVAKALIANGHEVRFAARAVDYADRYGMPAGVAMEQAPLPAHVPTPLSALASYSDILLSQGWGDPDTLIVLVRAWLDRFRAAQTDVLILDHSPTARLAARIAGLPTLALGNGFELPPSLSPLPAFPGIPGATLEKAKAADHVALTNACQVLARFGVVNSPETLCALLRADATCLATFPELDHYGFRQDGDYIGPLFGDRPGPAVDWPTEGTHRVFACLRPDTRQVDDVLHGLAQSGARVAVYAPEFPPDVLSRFASPRLRFSEHLLDLAPLLSTADACVSYGAEGTMMRFLLAGVPQLIMPGHVESQMAANRIEAMGAALVLRGRQTADSVAISLRFLTTRPDFRRNAETFAANHRDWKSTLAVDRVLYRLATISAAIEETCRV